MSDERRRIANDHWVHAFRDLVDVLGGELREFGSAHAFLGNLPMPFANGCLVLEETNPADLDAAVAWVSAAGVPFLVRVEEPLVAAVEGVLVDRGLVRDSEPMPSMALSPIPAIPSPPFGIRIDRVDHQNYVQFLDVLVQSGIPALFAPQIFPERMVESDNAAYFVASLDDEPVGISVAVRTGESGGIYSVATLEKARRRGVGTAVTWAAVEAIRDWGCKHAVLQSSAMGYSVYRAMGFEDATRYIRFASPTPASPTAAPPTSAPPTAAPEGESG